MKSAKQQFSGFFIVRKGGVGHALSGVRVDGPLARGLCKRVVEKGS